MKVSNSEHVKWQCFQRLARGSLVVSCVLLFVSVWAVWTYCSSGHLAKVAGQGALVNAVSYYNANRNAPVLSGVKSVAVGVKCGAGWTASTLNEGWVGSKAGCLTAGKTTVGACPKVVAPAVAGVAQAATAAKALKLWRGVQVCTEVVVAKTAAANWVYQAVGSKVCTKEAVKGFGVSCSSCVCGKAGTCPVTGGSWSTAQGSNNWVSAYAVDTQAVVFVQAEQLGVSCVDASLGPANKKWVWGLDAETRGCGVHGSDSKASVVVDHVALNDFLTSNGVVVSASLAAASVAGVDANLLVRSKVQTTCGAVCRGFNFDTSVVVANVGVWQSLKVLAWVAGWGTLVAFLVLLYFVLVKKRRATQSNYVFVVVWTLLVGLVVLVLLWVTTTDVGVNVQSANAAAVAAEAAGCVVDVNWAAVLVAWNASVNMDSLHTWLGWLTGVLALVWFVSCVMTLRAVSALGKAVQEADDLDDYVDDEDVSVGGDGYEVE